VTEYLTEEEILKMVTKFKRIRDQAIFLLMVQSGLRVSEVINIKISELDLEQNIILLKDTKNGIDYQTPITDETKIKIIEYIELERPNINNDYLFLSMKAQKLHRNTPSRYMKEAGIKINKNVWSHLLRHTCGTILRINGADIDTIKTQLRHKSYRSTERYIHAPLQTHIKNFNKYHPKIKD
jgi:integrase/recombinase XerD